MSRLNRRTFLVGAALAAAGCAPRRKIATTQAVDESPDCRDDPGFVEHSIKHISDEDLFAGLDLTSASLTKVRDAVASKDYGAAYLAWGDYWVAVAPDRARYIGDGDLLMTREQAVKSLQPYRADIVADADSIVAHKITGWGDLTIQHGPVADFNADYGNNGKYGFNYWGWSLKLVDAYLITNDSIYLTSFEELFNQWYEQRDRIHGGIPELDVVYYELGLGLRCRPFLEFYCSVKPQAATHERMLKTMLGSARWLYEEEKRKYRGGNWQIMGSYGLAWIGALLPEFREAQKWMTMGGTRIAQHVEADFFADGCHSERVPSSYMLVAYRDPRNLAMLLADRNQYSELSQRIRPKLQRILEWYFLTLPPDGIIPGINDGSRVAFPVALVRDARELFGMHLRAEARTPVVAHSVSLPASGFTVMRSDASKDALYMLINHGPSGGGHSHADSLDFEMHACGQAMAIDSGIGYTYDDPHQKSWYVRTRAHNALMVDGDDLNRKDAEGCEVVWTTLKRFDFFAATNRGYLASKGITHRRHIAFVKPLYWLVFDTINSTAANARLVSWNLHCPTEMARYETGFASETGPGLMVIPSTDWKIDQSTGPASVRGIRGFEPRDYADIDWIWFEKSIASGTNESLCVLMFPFPGARPEAKFRQIARDRLAAQFEIEHEHGVDHLLIGSMDSRDFRFDGDAALVRYQNGTPTSYSAAKTLTLSIAAKGVIDSVTPIDTEGNF